MNDKALTLTRMEDALDYRATTDELYAKRKTDLLRCEILCKRVRSRVMVTEEGAMDLRKAKAEGHPDVIAADRPPMWRNH